MYKEPKPMRDIHRIQKKFYDEEKKLTPGQRIRKLHKEATEVIRKYGLKIKTSSKV
jgi:hypothetical protein